MSDKRTVTTDALETLGTIIDERQKRDAIHLAVEPVIAGGRMDAGDHIAVIDGVAHLADDGDDDPPIGIVDPFLKAPVRKGQRFWFVMYPRTVHSLRHVWTHPAFPDETTAIVASDAPVLGAADKAKAASEAWIRQYCETVNVPSYEALMGRVAEDRDEIRFGTDASGEIPEEFWGHAEIVLGRKLEHRPDYFSCSC